MSIEAISCFLEILSLIFLILSDVRGWALKVPIPGLYTYKLVTCMKKKKIQTDNDYDWLQVTMSD